MNKKIRDDRGHWDNEKRWVLTLLWTGLAFLQYLLDLRDQILPPGWLGNKAVRPTEIGTVF